MDEQPVRLSDLIGYLSDSYVKTQCPACARLIEGLDKAVLTLEEGDSVYRCTCGEVLATLTPKHSTRGARFDTHTLLNRVTLYVYQPGVEAPLILRVPA